MPTRLPSRFSRLVLVFALILSGGGLLQAQFDFQPVGTVDLSAIDAVSSTPYGLTIHPDASLNLGYVALSGAVAPFGEDPALHSGSTVVEFRTDTLEVVRTFAVGFYPTELLVTPDGTTLYVTTSTESTLFEIDLGTGVVTGLPLTDSLGNDIGFLSGLGLSPDGTQVWVSSNGGSFDGSSENVVRVDRTTGAVLGTWEIAGGLGRFYVRSDGRVVMPIGFPGDDFSAPPQIQILDTSVSTANPTLVATLNLTVDTADFPAPNDLVATADGSRVYLTVFGGSAEVQVIDVDLGTLLPPIDLGGADFVQTAIGLTPDESTLLVGDFFANRLRLYDRATGVFQSEIPGLNLPNSMRNAFGRLFVTEQGLEQISVIALPGAFLRGDPNRSGSIDLADGIATLNFLFGGGSLACLEAADVDGGGAVDVADAVSIFAYLFQGGTAPVAPFPEAGAPAMSALGCGP